MQNPIPGNPHFHFFRGAGRIPTLRPEGDGWPGEPIQDGGLHSNPGGVQQS
jgi:hypothetical protein